MRPDMKNDQYEISNRFEFYFCLHEKVISRRPKNFVSSFWKQIRQRKEAFKNNIIDRYINYITTCRFLRNQYYLQIGYVKRSKFFVKLSELILCKTDVCFKRKKI